MFTMNPCWIARSHQWPHNLGNLQMFFDKLHTLLESEWHQNNNWQLESRLWSLKPDANVIHTQDLFHAKLRRIFIMIIYHGIHLVSWRWNDYSQYFVVCIMIMLAAVVKVLFHEIPILYKHFPESCVLIVLGVILGIIVYFGVDREGHHFPE